MFHSKDFAAFCLLTLEKTKLIMISWRADCDGLRKNVYVPLNLFNGLAAECSLTETSRGLLSHHLLSVFSKWWDTYIGRSNPIMLTGIESGIGQRFLILESDAACLHMFVNLS
jgi:hypothetical protein